MSIDQGLPIHGSSPIQGELPAGKTAPDNLEMTRPSPDHAPALGATAIFEESGITFDPATGTFKPIQSDGSENKKPTLLDKAAGQWKVIEHYAGNVKGMVSMFFRNLMPKTTEQAAPKQFNPETGQFE